MSIAQRTLQISAEDHSIPVPIRIFKPREVEPGHWACDYEIDWPHAPRRFAGYGADSMQALIIALQMIGVELYTSSYHRAGRLRAPGLAGGFGFPVAGNVRDMLEGDDRGYF